MVPAKSKIQSREWSVSPNDRRASSWERRSDRLGLSFVSCRQSCGLGPRIFVGYERPVAPTQGTPVLLAPVADGSGPWRSPVPLPTTFPPISMPLAREPLPREMLRILARQQQGRPPSSIRATASPRGRSAAQAGLATAPDLRWPPQGNRPMLVDPDPLAFSQTRCDPVSTCGRSARCNPSTRRGNGLRASCNQPCRSRWHVQSTPH
jgi:hypothetical protein